MNTLQPMTLDHSHRLCLEYACLTAMTEGGGIDIYFDHEARPAVRFAGLKIRGAPYTGYSAYTPQGALCLLRVTRTDLGSLAKVSESVKTKALEVVQHAIFCARFSGHIDTLREATEARRVRVLRNDLESERDKLVARLAEINNELAALPAP